MTNGLSGPRKQFLDVLRVLATCGADACTDRCDRCDRCVDNAGIPVIIAVSYGSGDLVRSYIFIDLGIFVPESGTYIDLSGHD